MKNQIFTSIALIGFLLFSVPSRADTDVSVDVDLGNFRGSSNFSAATRAERWFTDSVQKVKQFFGKAGKSADKSTDKKNLYDLGFAAEKQQDYSAAVRLYKAYIAENKVEKSEKEINSDCAAPYYRMALMAWNNSDTEEAESCFREAINCAAGNNRFIIACDFSRFFFEQNRLKDAEVLIRNIMIDYPNDKDFQLSLGKCIALQERPVESLRYFSDAYGGNREKGYEELAKVYWSANEPELAEFAERKQEELIAARIKKSNQSRTALAARTLEKRDWYVSQQIPVPIPKPHQMSAPKPEVLKKEPKLAEKLAEKRKTPPAESVAETSNAILQVSGSVELLNYPLIR